jgi:iron complex transport system permease protein
MVLHTWGVRWILATVIGILSVVVLRLLVGATDFIAPAEVWATLQGHASDHRFNSLIWEIRFPRALACILIGAMLAGVGSSFQALFRNPLADPFIVGVSAGASVGVAWVNVAGRELMVGGLSSVGAATLTGLASLALVYGLAWTRGTVRINHLLLGGVVAGSLLSSVTTLILTMGGMDTNQVMRKLLGSMTPMFWPQVAILAVVLAIGTPILMRESRNLNALAVGEETAARLGVNVDRLKFTLLVTGTVMTATTVGVAGIIGFLGLVAPHLARRIFGIDWRASLPGAMAVGALLLALADLLAMRLGEIQVGVVTAILGAPFLLGLLRRSDG